MSAIAQDPVASAELTVEAKDYLMANKPATGEGFKAPTPEEVMEYKKKMIKAEYGFAEDPGLKRKKAIDELGGVDNLPKKPMRLPENAVKGDMIKGQTYALGDGRVAVWTGDELHPVGLVGDGRFETPPPPPGRGFWGTAWDDAKWAGGKANDLRKSAAESIGLAAYGGLESWQQAPNASYAERLGMTVSPISWGRTAVTAMANNLYGRNMPTRMSQGGGEESYGVGGGW